MEGINDKKWFVYLNDHHEGPFSVDDIRAKMDGGAVTLQTYVWCEGMSDWRPMPEVREFSEVTKNGFSAPAPAGAVPSGVPGVAVVEDEKTGKMQIEGLRGGGPNRDIKGIIMRIVKLLLIVFIPLGLIAAGMAGLLQPVTQPMMEVPFIKATVGSVNSAIEPYFVRLVEKVPALAQYFSPIPSLEMVDPLEYEELKSAAMGPGQFALALDKSDLINPTFYVVTQVPDGTEFKLHIKGVGDTLLNATSMEIIVPVSMQKKLGRTVPAKTPEGTGLPRGEYIVSVIDANPAPAAAAPVAPAPASPTDPNAAAVDPAATVPAARPQGVPADAVPFKVFTKKSYFLGGIKDAAYDSRLKEYHERIRAKAQAELDEVRQLTSLIETQLQGTLTNFKKLSAAPKVVAPRGRKAPTGPRPLTALQKKNWEKFSQAWMKVNLQMNETFEKWTPESLKRDLFYYRLYEDARQAFQALNNVHLLHQAFFSDAANPTTFVSERDDAEANAKIALEKAQNTIGRALQLAPTPKGLPQREGL